MDVEAYLRRIEYDGPRQPTAETLHALHRRHLFTVPFENLDIPLGTPICLDPERGFSTKSFCGRRGGFCYELNGLFRELLTHAWLPRAPAFGAGPSRRWRLRSRVRSHAAEGGSWTSLGWRMWALAIRSSIPYRSCPEPRHEESGKSIRCCERRLTLEFFKQDKDGQVTLYRFSNVHRQLSDFEDMNQYQQTSPESGFTRRRICSSTLLPGRITLAGMPYIVTQWRDAR